MEEGASAGRLQQRRVQAAALPREQVHRTPRARPQVLGFPHEQAHAPRPLRRRCALGAALHAQEDELAEDMPRYLQRRAGP